MAFGLAETAKLAVDLSLKGNFSSALAANQKALAGFNAKITDTQGRAYKAGQQIGTGIKRGALLAVAGVGLLVPFLISMAKEGQKAANVQLIFQKAISNSGKVTALNVDALTKQQKALLELAGVDDELIKTEQTRLIQMGLTGDQVLKLTPLILDFSKATGVDLLTATKLAGKAVEGNTGALSRYGVVVDKAKAKTDPFAATVDALNSKFGGTSKVLSGSLNTRLDVLREKLANIREEAGIKLLPVFTRIVDVVGSRLVPAFGKLIDAFLPKAISGLNKLADFLDRGGATAGINSILDTIKTLMPAIEEGAKITGKVISTAVHLFQSLPPEIQGLAIAGLAVNKLTGGLVTNIAGGLIETVVSKLFNSLKSAVVNVNGAVVNVNGFGVGGVPGAAVPAAAGLGAGTIAAGIAAGTAISALGIMGLGWLITATSTPGQLAFNEQNAIDENRRKHGLGPATPAAPFIGPQQGLLTQLGSQIGNAFANAIKPTVFGHGSDIGAGGMIATLGKIPKVLDALHQSFTTDLAALIHATKANDIAAAARKVAAEVAKGVGNVDTTKNVLATLRKQLANTHDPKLSAVLRTAIAKVERRLPGREFAAKEFAATAGILRDGKITASESRKLKAIMQALKDHGLPHAAAAIQATIDAAKRAQTEAARLTTQAIKNKDLDVKVTIPISTQATTVINGRSFVGNVSRQTILTKYNQS